MGDQEEWVIIEPARWSIRYTIIDGWSPFAFGFSLFCFSLTHVSGLCQSALFFYFLILSLTSILSPMWILSHPLFYLLSQLQPHVFRLFLYRVGVLPLTHLTEVVSNEGS